MTATDPHAERATTAFEATEEHLDEVLAVAKADYAILWTFRAAAHEDERDMLVCGAYRSVDGVLMEGSTTVTFQPAEGVLGATWSAGTPFFVENVSAVDEVRFPRKQLAMFERVRSIAAFKFANGVLELGCKKGWSAAPALDKTSLEAADKKLPPSALITLNVEAPDPLRPVLTWTGSDYAIFYLFYEQVEELKCRCYAAVDGEIMRQSRTFPFTSGVGAIGRAWEAKAAHFIADACVQDPTMFLRQPLAEVYGVHSINFVCFKNGILEYGTRQRWAQPPALSVEQAKALGVPDEAMDAGSLAALAVAAYSEAEARNVDAAAASQAAPAAAAQPADTAAAADSSDRAADAEPTAAPRAALPPEPSPAAPVDPVLEAPAAPAADEAGAGAGADADGGAEAVQAQGPHGADPAPVAAEGTTAEPQPEADAAAESAAPVTKSAPAVSDDQGAVGAADAGVAGAADAGVADV